MISAKRSLKLIFWQSMTGFWGILLSSLIVSALVVSVLALAGAGVEQFKISIQVALLLTLVLLLHRNARHFLLFPAGIAVMCSLFGSFRYLGYF
ncbi:DUF1435 domain-containing protein [Xenorhabdus sp. Reich]|uniref:DUF1435 domain-containing protein n=1 Tax=Xenorhabdus littoralis TaxID=2582835 RepID=A0ABU4SQM6_9GAMM|nr:MULTISPECIES: DUF1435 family protein [unclassified Xenorhabdus]MDX7992939.1 DUF1435 domain-containing protein [Xenorhabdus sp. psl]MDX8000876.1 DUF1435 domain-containing protein [Xenorhabdus sp. Reich]